MTCPSYNQIALDLGGIDECDLPTKRNNKRKRTGDDDNYQEGSGSETGSSIMNECVNSSDSISQLEVKQEPCWIGDLFNEDSEENFFISQAQMKIEIEESSCWVANLLNEECQERFSTINEETRAKLNFKNCSSALKFYLDDIIKSRGNEVSPGNYVCPQHCYEFGSMRIAKRKEGNCKGYNFSVLEHKHKAPFLSTQLYLKSFRGNSYGILPGSFVCWSCKVFINANPDAELNYKFASINKVRALVGLDSVTDISCPKTNVMYSLEVAQKLVETLNSGNDAFQFNCKDALKNVEDLNAIKSNVKRNLQKATRDEKIQLLSITPWNAHKTHVEFGCDRRHAEAAIKLATQPNLKIHKTPSSRSISQETRKIVEDFYLSDQNSCLIPISKKGSNTENVTSESQVAKRQLLKTLKELYTDFHKEHPSLKIGLSVFSTYRPKYCKLAVRDNTNNKK